MNQELERLEIRIGLIRERMAKIRSEGLVAPPRTWIQKYYVQKKCGKRYYYYRLLEATDRKSSTGSIQGKVKIYLGSKKSSEYHKYKAAIRRRNELKFLQSRLDELMVEYEKAIVAGVGKGNRSSSVSKRSSQERDFPIATVERLEESIERLWHWLKVIATKLGIALPSPQRGFNST